MAVFRFKGWAPLFPMQAFYDGVNVKQVDVSSTTGSFGILPNHVPAISVLKPGLVSIYEENKITKYFGMLSQPLPPKVFMLSTLQPVLVQQQ